MGNGCSIEFMKLSTDVAKRFLHTVVFVDDQAVFKDKEKPGTIKTPTRELKKEESTGIIADRIAHELDAKKVMDEFVSKGIVCSVLKPSNDQSPLDIVKGAAKRADIFILDWKINDDDGKTAKEIIEKIISFDKEADFRLRLIVIYTGEPDISSISKSIGDKIQEQFGGDFRYEDDNFAMCRGHLRIAVFAKEQTMVPESLKNRVLSIEELPDRLSVEFAKITSGLVSNVALEAMSVLRDNTHIILGKLGPEMDPPYLAHRALLPNPDDAMNHVIDIIASEFHSFLENNEIGEKADINAIKAWLDVNKSFFFNAPWKDNVEFDYTQVCELQRVGIEQSDWFKSLSGNKQKQFTNHAHKTLTQTFCNDNVRPIQLDFKFAMLTSLKNRQEENIRNPILTLGTILKKDAAEGLNDNGNLWLCLQPRCDCTRIEEKRKFFFLPLNEVDGDNNFDILLEFDEFVKLKLDCETYAVLPVIKPENKSTFDIILENYETKFTKLKINYNTYDTSHFEFSSKGSEQVIRAVKEGNYFFFNTTSGIKFRWVSELKKEHAQRITNDFSAKLSRVGLDESEWLRRY